MLCSLRSTFKYCSLAHKPSQSGNALDLYSGGIYFKSLVSLPVILKLNRAIAQAVSRWLPTAAARFRARTGHVGFMVYKVTLGQVFSRVFWFPLPIIILPEYPSS
jgi:hypothetical protein